MTLANAYPAYRASGLPWVPRLPEGWQVLRNGRLFGHRVETGFPDLPILEVSLRTGVRVRDMENLKRKQVMSQKEKYKRAARGDIAYNMMRMWQGAVGPAPVDGLVSPAYVVVKPYAEANSSYYSYLFRTAAYMQEINKYSRGIVADRNRLYWESFKQMPSLVPPRTEQDQIVAYLRVQDAHIARLIKAKRDLIKLLTEQKFCIIDDAVTRGIDTSVALRPSGVERIGDVPAHWEVLQLRRVSRCLDGARIPLNATERGLRQGTYPYWGANKVIDHLDGWLFDEPLVLLGEDGAPFFDKTKEVAFPVSGKIWVNNHAHVLRPSSCITPRYLAHTLNCVDYTGFIDGSTRDKLTQQSMKSIRIPLPQVSEQIEICKHIESACAPLNVAIERTEREIVLIREYRDRLIADVVTGQVDVRSWQPGPDDVVDDEVLAALGDDQEDVTEEEDGDGED
ncbi:restriction endonuclease subunit S [Pseudomonas sp. CBC3]|uniref:restriction endonuclease subunit S n=1 Tax=Pseudomonas sp. CBC3 TaxID=3123318 RepID=UPI0030E91B89